MSWVFERFAACERESCVQPQHSYEKKSEKSVLQNFDVPPTPLRNFGKLSYFYASS
jgi:hypothetical protein